MKIVIAAEIFPPDIGGPATYSASLSGELLARGHNIKLISYGEKDWIKYSPPPIRVGRRSKLPVRYFKYFRQLLKISFSADVIYAQGPVSSGWPALWVKRLLRKKLVVKVVGDYAWESYQNQKSIRQLADKNQKDGLKSLSLEEFQRENFSGKIGWLRKIERKVCRGADAVIAPSCYLKNIVAGWGAAPEKIKVIYNSVEKINLMLSKNEAKQKIKQSGDLILSVGRLVSWKGFSALIEIMPRLLEVNPNFKLIVIGDGPEREALKSQLTRLPSASPQANGGQATYNLQEKVFLIGKVAQPEVIYYLKAADMFVLNSGYEGLSHTILEAMSAGAPIIASNIGGNPELIKHNHNGLLVDYNDKEGIYNCIVQLWRDKNLQNKFVNNSEEDLEKFKFSKMIEETIKVLKQ